MDLYLYSTNNINSTSTPYSYFHSTQIFFQLQLKLFYFNQKMSIQLLYLKFPDIPNVYQQKLTAPSQIRRTFDTPTQSLGMRSQSGVGRRQADSNSTEWNGATTSGSASNASLLPRTRNLISNATRSASREAADAARSEVEASFEGKVPTQQSRVFQPTGKRELISAFLGLDSGKSYLKHFKQRSI